MTKKTAQQLLRGSSFQLIL